MFSAYLHDKIDDTIDFELERAATHIAIVIIADDTSITYRAKPSGKAFSIAGVQKSLSTGGCLGIEGIEGILLCRGGSQPNGQILF